MERVIPIPTLHLFPKLHSMLMELLASLSPEDWHKPTVAKQWDVKDVVAHLLDGNMRTASMLHQYQSNDAPPQINSYQDLVNFLNNLNDSWVKAMKRVSPQLLMGQMEATAGYYDAYMNSLDPLAPAMFPVSWAGETTSLNWFHIAREYTEKWHHQQQIRDAVDKPGLLVKELYYPCIATFMYALPHGYRNTAADEGSIIRFTVGSHDELLGHWYLQRRADAWMLTTTFPEGDIVADVSIPADVAWRFFTKAITPDAALQASVISGDLALGKVIFSTLAVMA